MTNVQVRQDSPDSPASLERSLSEMVKETFAIIARMKTRAAGKALLTPEEELVLQDTHTILGDALALEGADPTRDDLRMSLRRVFGPCIDTFTPGEMRFLKALHARVGRVCSYEALAEIIYSDRNIDERPEPKIMTVRACRVRAKLRSTGYRVECAWGRGYRLVAPGAK